MPQLTAATCTRCGAPLHLDPSAPKQICSFCGNEHFFSANAPPQAAPATPPLHAPPLRPFAPLPTSPAVNANPVAFVAAGFLVLALVGGIVAASLGGRGRGSSSALPGGGGIVPPGERLQWSSNGVNVVP